MIFKNLVVALLLLFTASGYSEDKNPPVNMEQPALPDDTTVKPSGVSPLPPSTEITHSYEGAFVRMIVTLVGLLLLIFVTFWILRRLGQGKFKMSTGKRINILEKKALSPKSMLYIVEIGNKKVLIAESQVEVRALTTCEMVPEVSE